MKSSRYSISWFFPKSGINIFLFSSIQKILFPKDTLGKTQLRRLKTTKNQHHIFIYSQCARIFIIAILLSLSELIFFQSPLMSHRVLSRPNLLFTNSNITYEILIDGVVPIFPWINGEPLRCIFHLCLHR
jgi:hypothetical protein